MKNGGPLEESIAFYFINADTGFYGSLSCLYKTMNGGITWMPQEIPPDANPSTPENNTYRINRIYFSGIYSGWATANGLYSCVLKTVDGGESWQLAYNSFGTSQYYSNLHFCDSLHGGYLVTSSYSPAVILTSSNFDSVYGQSLFDLPSSPTSLFFQNDSTVWIGGSGDGIIIRSYDGGIKYDTLNPTGFQNRDFFITGFAFYGEPGYAIGSHIFKYIDTLNTAVPSKTELRSLQIFPNPSAGLVNFRISSHETETAELYIYSQDGRCVWNKSEKVFAGENDFRYSFANLKPGIYLLKITDKRDVISQKFILH